MLATDTEAALASVDNLVLTKTKTGERLLPDPRVQAPVLITNGDRFCELSINIERYHVPSLTQALWQQFFSSRGMAIELATLEKIHTAYGGNAKAMGILYGTIQADFTGNAKYF